MSYELNAEGINGVNDTTVVVALGSFNVPQAPPDSTGEPDAKAIWVVDASALNAAWPATGPVDGIWSTAGDGGASGVVGSGSNDGTGVGVSGSGGGVGGGGTGVVGFGKNGVVGTTNSSGGIPVMGANPGGGTGVVGWAASPPSAVPIEGGGPGRTPFSMPEGEVVGVYGCVSDDLAPSNGSMQSGVWGDARDSNGRATAAGVTGTAQRGVGGVFSSDSGAGVSGSSRNSEGAVFESESSAQLRLVPASVPLEATSLLDTGQVGDLYLYSQAHEVGTSGTYDYATILWLCIAPPVPGGQAMWAQVQLGDTVGG